MTDPFQSVQQLGMPAADPFPAASRYHGLGVARLALPGGKLVAYLRRRFVPQPERFVLLQQVAVTQGDRLDNLAARYLGDPERFWVLCDANRALRPEELTEEVGRLLRITLPEGLPGPRP